MGISLFTDGWSFLRTEADAKMEEVTERWGEFVPVEVPHDWLIYDTKNLYRDGCGWYRKMFRAEEKGGDRGHTIVRFDGVYMDSTVYLNGRKICDWKYGYSAFEADLTDMLQKGDNTLLVQVRFLAPNSRWYSGAGIFRNVWLKQCGAAYLPIDGTYLHTKEEEGGYLLEAETEIETEIETQIEGASGNGGLFVRYTLWKDQRQVGETVTVNVPVENHMSNGSGILTAKKISASMHVRNPRLWSTESPECYEFRVELCRGAQTDAPEELCEILDRQIYTVGFRTFRFTQEQGLFVNGEHVKLHGVCEHHDLGCLGAAFYETAMKRKLKLLKRMGCNAIRISHNMPAAEVMELCDRMGFLVLEEAFDMWERSKTTYDYARFFKDWHAKDIRSMVRRDRNHPCLLMWSIGNEIYDTHADSHGQEIARELLNCVQKDDPKGNAPVTICSNYMAWENAQKCADIVKYAGYNYGEKYYDEQHKAHPDWIMYGSETASLVQSRGVYHFPLAQSVLADEDEQCSALGNSNTSWGARSWEKCVTVDRDRDFIAGQFLWTGFDYIGEPTPYHTKNSYFGLLDTAGFPKDSWYFFQAEWTDGKKAPMVHVFPYWDFNPGQRIDVRACTNASAVELFVNGKSCGRQEIDHRHGARLIADWNVSYEPGTIEAVAYDENGQKVAADSRCSFKDSHRIRLTADKETICGDGRDLCFVTVETLDKDGNKVENAADYVHARIEGPGRILGTDNGDSTDEDSYQSPVRKLFSGKLLIVVAGCGKEGVIRLVVTGKGLLQDHIEIRAESMVSVSTAEERTKMPQMPEVVPARKIELSCAEGQLLSRERPSVMITAKLFPPDTTERELVWKAVNAGGIEVGYAKICLDGDMRARLTAIGDGDFYVRCMAKEAGTERARLISQLEFQAKGLGKALLDPYGFISAGLYTKAVGEISNGNEKGIATARDGESGVVFEGIDFGDFGSDTFTMPVFALSGEDYEIDFWLGEPFDPESTLLKTLHYRKPSKWNVYQEETWKLPARLRGVCTIALILRAKAHIKGFSFERQNKALSRLTGADLIKVYGDSFVREKTAVRGIGNNVTLDFGDFDFGEEGVEKICIGGHTPLPNNTIHLHFTREDTGETVVRILEYKGEKNEQTFSFGRLCGKGRIELVFLPGSSFDFEYLQFKNKENAICIS